MKKLFLLFVALAAFQLAHAQKSELSFSYGIPTNKSIDSSIGDAFGSALFDGLAGIDNEKFTGAFNLEYMYRLADRWAVGLDLAYEHSSSDLYSNKEVVAKIKDNYLTIMVGGKYYWKNGSMFRMYAKTAIGVSFMKEKVTDVVAEKYAIEAENQTDFAYQISPIAFEVGKNFCGFLELGYGNQGIAQAGVRVRF